jgi:hypothetical protein
VARGLVGAPGAVPDLPADAVSPFAGAVTGESGLEQATPMLSSRIDATDCFIFGTPGGWLDAACDAGRMPTAA